MVALDLNRYWGQAPYELIGRLKRAGCTHYKVHKKLPTMDIETTARALRNAILPGKSATLMIDIKKYDIESQLIDAVEEHVTVGFNLVTVHASVGRTILSKVVKEFGDHVVAVTALTGIEDQDFLAVYGKTRAELEIVLGKIAFDSGITAGIVCSAPGIPALQQYVKGVPFMTPGIRLAGHASNDQVAVATPKEAVNFGSSLLITGRPIIESKHPEKVFADIQAQVAAA
ncbi:MAG: orotidine 5'-phosphate decarboxylase / HUMPS family protein [Candidatus Adlerbacteria bacterium]